MNRPAKEPGFRLRRIEAEGRMQRYAIEPYATTLPEGRRYR